jgi:hypothetical protein
MARGVAPLPGGAAAQQHLPAGEPFGRCQARSFRLLPPPDRYSGSSAARSRTSAARSRASARWLRSSAARSRSSAMWSRWSAARSRAARTSWVRSGLRCVGPARSGPPATPVRPPSPRLGCPDPGVVQRLGRDPLPLDVLDELLGDLGQLARRRPHPPRRWWNAWSNVIPSVAATIPLACSIQTRLASACRSWATSTWWLANSTAVRTNSGSPPRTPQRLDLGWRPGPRLGGIHIQGPDRLVGQRTGTLRTPAPAAVGPRPRSGRRPAPCTSPGRPHPVLGEGGQAWPLAEVALDLLQQLHRRIRGRHPPGLAVLTGQGEAGAIDPDHRPGYLHHPSQPGQQILGLRHGPQLGHAPCDKSTIHRCPWSFARADIASAAGHRWPHPAPELATEPGTLVDPVGHGWPQVPAGHQG